MRLLREDVRASTPAWPALNFWSMAGQPLQWQGPWIYSGDPSRLCSPSRQLANLLPSTAGPSHQHWNRETINAETMNNIFQESRSHQGAWHHTQACNPAFQSCHLLPPPPPPPAPAVSPAGVHRASISSRVLPCKRTQRCCQRRGEQPGRPGSLQLRLARLAAPQAHGRPRRGCTPGGALSPSALSPWHAAGKPAPARVIGKLPMAPTLVSGTMAWMVTTAATPMTAKVKYVAAQQVGAGTGGRQEGWHNVS